MFDFEEQSALSITVPGRGVNVDEIRNDLILLSRRVTKCGILKLYVDGTDADLVALYRQHTEQHNRAILESAFPNSGFDVFIPQDTVFETPIVTQMVNLGIKTEMLQCDIAGRRIDPSAFLVHPRSSISKTQLMLANHTGIIDSGYRGFLMGAFRWLYDGRIDWYPLQKHTRLLQICMPSLDPILVYLVENEDALSTTERGDGGFGSTGIVGTQNG